MKFLKIALLITAFVGVTSSCNDQLDVKNPNEPTADVLNTETGIVKFALAGIYINGFVDNKFVDGVVGNFWGNGFFDMMADNLGAEAANVFMNQIGCPESVTIKSKVVNPGTDSIVMNPNSPTHQPDMIRQNDSNANGGQNPIINEWSYMYSLIRSCNLILGYVDGIEFSGDSDTKVATLKAWAYWWKGFAYSRIGSIYYAGVINDNLDVIVNPSETNGDYKSNVQILAEAENNFSKCETILNSLTIGGDYSIILGKIIPDFCQVGNGGILSPAEWKRNINTLRARNLLANKTVATMSSADWDQIITLTNDGIGISDKVFTIRSNDNGDILSPTSGAVAARSTGDPASAATYKISERLIQQFRPGDERFDNNFTQLEKTWVGNSDRGNAFNTRWQLEDGGTGLSGVIVYSNKTAGAYELFVAGSYEENELMKAEANIYKGSIDAGVALIDAIRDFQGSTIASGAGLTSDEAIAELRSERRVALLFRSVAFYDARRYGVINPLASGGGLDGTAIVVDKKGFVNVNASIDYQFLDYWDVPDNELTYNPANAGSAPVKNPNN